ncbi:ubiquitin-conjugating enzyme E2 W isoform X2 [Notamacropus eugenii]|uniref:ubiquitin-conjugating enzyme E2 W isoform X2 n=2 Tax=Theria TaxID=32525 RepID=UPI003B67961D
MVGGRVRRAGLARAVAPRPLPSAFTAQVPLLALLPVPKGNSCFPRGLRDRLGVQTGVRGRICVKWERPRDPEKRLQKELLALQNDPPPGMTLNEKSVQNSITQWIVDMEGAPGTLYEGEKFQLLFKFSSRYPFDSPQRRPPDNSFYVRTCNKNPKKTKWWYHDDTC